jgi:glycosyltransferase involved in cell wall biosynthesis
MRIVMVSDEETAGGAAVAASRLADGLVEAGVDVVRVVGHADGARHRWVTRSVAGRTVPTVARLARRVADWFPAAASLVQARRIRGELDAALEAARPDVVNVHNLHSVGWLPAMVETCVRHAPTAWTLHDMWSFTGRCAYAYDCRKFVDGCDAGCPTPAEYPALEPDRIAGAWRARRSLLGKRRNLVAVCPSRWMAHEAGRGLWAGHRIEVVPYGLPLDVYRALAPARAREMLGLAAPRPVALVAAQVLTERRKGGPVLAEVLAAVRTRPFTLLLLGHGTIDVREPGVHVHSLGYVTDEATKIAAYAAADVLLHPAPVDNLPNVILEALACGTPCVAFPVGGLADAVRPGATGWLAAEVTPKGLAGALDQAFASVRNGVDLRASCRAVAEEDYDERQQANRYLELFTSMLRERRGSGRP